MIERELEIQIEVPANKLRYVFAQLMLLDEQRHLLAYLLHRPLTRRLRFVISAQNVRRISKCDWLSFGWYSTDSISIEAVARIFNNRGKV